MEEWRDIPDFDGLYQISNNGTVLNIKRGTVLKQQISNCGYVRVCLSKNGQPKKYSVHRLVWSAFNGEIPEGMQINHINEDKLDNRLVNLNMLTPQENLNWGTRNKRASVTNTNGSRAIPVCQYDLEGNFIKRWVSASEVERQLGYCSGHISNRCRGKGKTYKGFIWKYAS